MASGKSSPLGRPAKAGPEKLGQTLQDLEAAFADWEALSDEPKAAEPAAISTTSTSSTASSSTTSLKDIELRKKTKKLLDQLRQQLADLAD